MSIKIKTIFVSANFSISENLTGRSSAVAELRTATGCQCDASLHSLAHTFSFWFSKQCSVDVDVVDVVKVVKVVDVVDFDDFDDFDDGEL